MIKEFASQPALIEETSPPRHRSRPVIFLIFLGLIIILGGWLDGCSSRATITPEIVSQTTNQTATPTPSMQIDPGTPLPPVVLAFYPETGQELAVDGYLELVFDQAMRPTATGNALQMVDPQGDQVEGETTWSDQRTLRFTPLDDLQSGATYTVTLSTEASSAEGIALAEAIVWQVNTTGALQVLQVFPAGGTANVETDSIITVIFNRPVAPLVIVENMEGLPDPLVITPAVSGQGEWINTSVYAYRPDGHLRGSTEYTIVVEAGLADATGDSILAEDYQWTFSTAAPAITGYWMVGDEWNVNPYDRYPNVLLDEAFVVSFFQAMNRESVEANVSIVSATGEPALLDFLWNEDSSMVVITPTQRLAYGTLYTLTLSADAQDENGGSLQYPLEWSFYTVPVPAIREVFPEDGTVLSEFHSEFSIYFTTPMDFDTLRNRVVFSPTVEDSDMNWWYDEWGWSLFYYGLQPSTEYEVRILPGMSDIYGTEITEETVIRFTNGAYYPNIYLNLPYYVAVFREGGSQEFFAGSLNVEEAQYRLYELPLDRFVGLQNGTVEQWRFSPPSNTLVWEFNEAIQADLDEYTMNGYTPVTSEGQPLPPGYYFLTVVSPQVPRYGNPFNDTRVMMVVDSNLTLKHTQTEILAWLTDLESGAPLPGVALTVLDEDMTLIGSGTTDQDGLLYLTNLPSAEDGYRDAYYVFTDEGQEHFSFASSSWSSDFALYNYGIWLDYYSTPERFNAYIYTERPIYRPGQPVYFRGIIRRDDDLQYSLPGFDTVRVAIYSYEETVYDEILTLSEYGSIDGQFILDSEAALGEYYIDVSLPESGQVIGSVGFNVAEYRRPEFRIFMEATPVDLLPHSTFTVTLQAEYYAGGSVSNAEVSWLLMAQRFYFTPPPEYSGYSFTDYDLDYGYYYDGYQYYEEEVIAQGTGLTDENGQLVLTLPAELAEAGGSRQLTFGAAVTDIAGTVVGSSITVVVHRSAVYPGVRPQTYVGEVGEEETFELVVLDWGGTPVVSQTVAVEIVERRWYSVQEEDAQGRLVWTSTVEDIPVVSYEDIVTDADGRASVSFVPPNGGVYKATVTALDEHGNEGRASSFMWVAGDTYIPWRQSNDPTFQLVVDKDSYEPGETAEILIASPFQGEAYALVTVERGHVRSYEVILLQNNSTIYQLPITPDMAPNVYVFVTIVQGIDETNPTPDYRIGVAQVRVNTSEQLLSVTVTPDRLQAGPGEDVTYTVQTTDVNGQPVSAELSLGLSDLATLSLMPANSPPILDYFYASRALGVWTTMPLAFSVEFYNYEVVEAMAASPEGGRGGGGKGGDIYGVIEVRQDFPDTAYWEAHLITDEDGLITVTVTLPDNLTTWRMEARAATLDTLVGQTFVDIVSTKPLLVRPQTPRFFVADDRVILGTAVHNNTEEDLEVEVVLNGEGIILEGEASHTVVITAGMQVYVTWEVIVLPDAERVDLVFSAVGGEYSDASRPTLATLEGGGIPVYRYEVPETVGTSGQMLDGGTIVEAISLPPQFTVTQGELTVEIAPSLAAGMTDGLTYLEHFPYECVEQTVSRFLPNVVSLRALRDAGLSNPELEANLEAQVSTALQRLYNWQNPDGGWGWWGNQQSNPLTSAYVVLGFIEASQAGFPISENVLSDGISYLNRQLIVVTRYTPPDRLNRQAFLLYVLARADQPNVSKTTQLFDQRRPLAVYASAYLAHTMYMIDPDDSRIDTLLSDIANAAILSATGTHWEEAVVDYWNWNTDTRTTAIVLSALSVINPENPLNANAVRWLMSSRTNGHWASTQETAWTLMALTNWMVVSGELEADYSYAVAFNGETIGEGVANAETLRETYELRIDVSEMLADEANRLAVFREQGPGNLYYTAHLEVYLPASEVQPLERGIIVSRSYHLLDDPSTAITQASQGDLIQVRLTIVALHDLHYVVIDDPLPAGFEAVDQSLLTSPPVEQPTSYSWDELLLYGWGRWYFDHVELRDERVVLSAGYLPAGTYVYTYLVRASTPGTFQVIPPIAYEFYFPEVYGRGAGSEFVVLP